MDCVCVCVCFGEFGVIWVAESAQEVFDGFEGEVCAFPVSKGLIRILLLDYVIEDIVQLAVEVCDMWERLQAKREHHCQKDADMKGAYKTYWLHGN